MANWYVSAAHRNQFIESDKYHAHRPRRNLMFQWFLREELNAIVKQFRSAITITRRAVLTMSWP